MRIIVNDANILIDVVELALLPHFFALEADFLTTSLVFEELEVEQQYELNDYIESGELNVKEMTLGQLSAIHNIQKNKPSLSLQDCSAFYQAKIEEGVLLTSDNTLRKFAKANKLKVHGHLWVFDRMVEAEAISRKLAAQKLQELCEVVNQNLGLPEQECQERINQWNEIPQG